MSRVFQVKPKRLKRSNGTVLTPEMVVTLTTMQHTATPFYNGAKEVQEAYMRIYAFDYKKITTVGSCIGWLVDACFSFMKASAFVGSDKE